MPRIIETEREFDERHGPRIHVHGRWLHGDGAQQSTERDHRMEPPADEIELLKLKIEFLDSKIAKKVRLYNEARRVVNDQLNMLANRNVQYNLPLVPDEEIEALKQGADEIEGLKAEVKALRDQVPIPEHILRQNAQDLEQAKRVAATRSKFNELPNF